MNVLQFRRIGRLLGLSLNPSTIGPALYLATDRKGSFGVAGFRAGVFVISTLGGLLLTLGPGQALLASVPHPDRHLKHVIELVLGGAVFLLAAALWMIRKRVARTVVGAEERSARNSFFLGAGIMAVELPTALAAVIIPGVAFVAATALLLLGSIGLSSD